MGACLLVAGAGAAAAQAAGSRPAPVPANAAAQQQRNSTAQSRNGTAQTTNGTAQTTGGAAQGGSSTGTAGQTAAAGQQAETPQMRKVQALIQQVERSYNSGVENYRTGHLEAARSDFDMAVDLMLTSGIDIKNDATLSDAFERTVDRVNALEMDALKQGNGFTPKTEESPIETAGDLTVGASPELTAKLSTELGGTQSDLPLVVNDQVAGYINIFANSPSFHAHMLRSLERAGRYKDLIQRVLKEEGVPQDLIYLAVAESGFQLQAVNYRSGAGGMWQFMPFQGAYGLARNGYFDERFDPEKSSRAYARYIKSLYNQFGDWYLAMAAYDWGPGNVQKAVMRTGYADFWQLYRRNALPRETREYVPKILAAVLMAKNPAKYGLDHVTPEPAATFDMVGVDYALDLRLAADLTNTSLANIVALNPSLLRLSTPRDMHFDLRIPAGTKDDFTARVAAIPEDKRATWRFHEMKAGESAGQVAQMFHVTEHELLAANNIASASDVGEGDELVVPVAGGGNNADRPQTYRPRRGDTLVTVADRFNVSPEDLRSWNHLRTSTLPLTRAIFVSEPVRLAPAGRGRALRRGGHRGKAARGSKRKRR